MIRPSTPHAGALLLLLCTGAPPLLARDAERATSEPAAPSEAALSDARAIELAASEGGSPLQIGGGSVRVSLRSIPVGDPRREAGTVRGHEQGEISQHQGDLVSVAPASESEAIEGPRPGSGEAGATRGASAPGSWHRSFEGTTASGWIPPDPVIAAGPKYLVEVVNSGFEIYSKDGDRERAYTDLETFFSPLYAVLPEPWSVNSFVFDPRVVYSPMHGQFVLMALGRDDNNIHSYIFFAISATADPLGDWYLYWTASPNFASYWIDYAGLSADTWGVYFTGNEIGWSSGSNGGLVLSVRPSVFDGSWTGAWIFTGRTWNETGNPQARTIQPGVPHTIAGDDATFFVNTFTSSGSSASIWKLTGDRGSSPTLVRTSATVEAYTAPGTAAQPGVVLDDIEMYSAGTLTAAYSNRKIYFSLNDAGTGQSGFYVSKVDVDSFAQDRNITYYSPSTYYYYPAVGVAGDVADPIVGVALSWSGNDVYPSGAVKLFQNFTVDSSGEFWDAAPGVGTYNVYFNGRNRWGDYLGIATDPTCGTFWTVTEFTSATNVWSTRLSMFEGQSPLTGVCALIFDDGFERGDRTSWSNF